jgi:hypothetical protein
MLRVDVVGTKANLRLSCLSVLHSWLSAAALGKHTDTAFWQVGESKGKVEFDCDEAG